MPDAFAVFTEPLAAALEISEQIHLRPDSRVLIIGDGKLGLLIALALRLNGCDLHLVGRHPDKMDLVAARGVTTHMAEEFAEKEFRCRHRGHRLSRRLAGCPGRSAAPWPRGGEKHLSRRPGFQSRRTGGAGNHCRRLPVRTFPPGPAPVGPKIDQPQKAHFSVYPLAQAPEALAYASQRGVLKVLVEMPF